MDTRIEALIGNEYAQRLVELFAAAKHRIDIVVFDWRWYENEPGGDVGRFNMAVAAAAKRGVKVRAVVNSDNIATRLKSVGVEVHRPTSKNLLHVKLVLIDDKIAVLGSHNFTRHAFSVNMEASIVLEGEHYPPRLKEFFETLWLL